MDNKQHQTADFVVIDVDNHNNYNNYSSTKYINVNDLEANKYINTDKRSFLSRLFN